MVHHFLMETNLLSILGALCQKVWRWNCWWCSISSWRSRYCNCGIVRFNNCLLIRTKAKSSGHGCFNIRQSKILLKSSTDSSEIFCLQKAWSARCSVIRWYFIECSVFFSMVFVFTFFLLTELYGWISIFIKNLH